MPVSTLSSNKSKHDKHESKLLSRTPSSASGISSESEAKCDLEGTSSTQQKDDEEGGKDKEEDNNNLITHSIIPINFPFDLNLNLNCVLLPSTPTSASASNQNSPVISSSSHQQQQNSNTNNNTLTLSSSSPSSSIPNSLSISSISSTSISPISSASASPASSSCSSSSGFYEKSNTHSSSNNTSNSGRKYRLNIVKIEEEEEVNLIAEDSISITLNDDVDKDDSLLSLSQTNTLNCTTNNNKNNNTGKVVLSSNSNNKKEYEEEHSTSYCLSGASTAGECDLDFDFDDVDFNECYDEDDDNDNENTYQYDEFEEDENDDDDTDVEITSSSIVSPCTLNAISDSNSNSSFNNNNNTCCNQQSVVGKKRKKKNKNDNHSLLGIKSDEDDSNHYCSDESEYLSLENPNPVPCIHCQGNKDHFIDDNLVWPIKLDLDLIETLVQLCPEFFTEFGEEVDMDSTTTSSDDQSNNNNNSATSANNLTSPPSNPAGDNNNLSLSSAGLSLNYSQTPFQSPQSNPESSASSVNVEDNSNSNTSMDSSPPQVQVDDSPLQNSMDRNKESLKVKLLLRRPMNQLVEQGILPPPKTPPAFAGQRVRLERARMSDLLKAKIQQRPARQELIRQHILEDSNARVAPALAEKQRMLKKARLADSLNDHLIHRPGPLELVQKNILHAPDATIDQAIKEGAVSFKATCEGHIPGPQLPHSYLSEDDSSSDLSSPAGTPDQSQSSSTESSSKTGDANLPTSAGPSNSASLQEQTPSISTTANLITSPPPVSILSPAPPPPPLPFQQLASPIVTTTTPNQQIQNQILSRIVQAAVTSSTVPPLTSAQLTLSKLSQLDPAQLNTLMNNVSQNQGQRTFLVAQGINFNNQPIQQQHACASKSRSSKKSSKPKSQPKARQIKFHEYKGPPSAQKSQHQSQQQDVESSYELLLQQQQLFLQWQLEWQHKYPQIILPAVSKLTSPTEATAKLLSSITAAGATLSVHTATPTVSTVSISSVPTVLSPSTISSVTNPTILPNTMTPISSSGHFPISQVSTVQNLENANTNISKDSIDTIPQPVPSTSFASSSNTITSEPKSVESSSNASSAMEISTSAASSNESPAKAKNLSKLNDWKVNDLRAELKRRNLPVSGAKPQLIERLKLADATLQDESISTTTTNNANTKNNGNNNSVNSSSVVIKSEVQTSEEKPTCYEMMDVSEAQSSQKQQTGISKSGVDTHVKEVKMDIKPVLSSGSNNINANAALLALLHNNNIKLNSDGSIPAYVLNALASVINRPVSSASSSKSPSSSATTSQPIQNIVFVDDTIIHEQRKHIEQLQEALKNSQQQLLQMKSQQGGGQKHRLALQQHLQHKMQQQALQAQLQKLQKLQYSHEQLQKLQIQLQLHSLQQQQQQQQNQTQPTKVQLSQVSSKIQPQFPHVQVIAHPQRAIASSNQFILPKSADGFDQQKLLTNKNQANVTSARSTTTTTCTTTNSNNNIPYAILKIATNTTTHSQTPDKDGLHISIPQILIPNEKDASFQIGKSDSSHGSSSIPVPPVSADQADQSWLLKINEIKEDSRNSDKELSNFFDDILRTSTDSKINEENKLVQASSSNNSLPKKKTFKSQMVDDVLEILIRHGELPPSAAQEPQTPTTPGKSPSILSYPRNLEIHHATPDGTGHVQPPPPPPLPPATFAVTLPTSISFPKPSTASVFSGHTATPIVSAVIAGSDKTSSSNLNLTQSHTIPTSEILSKEAQDILKISEDLSNFGRAHAQSENQNRILSPSPFTSLSNKISHGSIKLEGHEPGNDNLSMLLGDVEKELHLVDDMDVVLDDGFHQHHALNQNQVQNTASNNIDSPMTTIDDALHNQSHPFQNYSNVRSSLNYGLKPDGLKHHQQSSDELLEELETLIPEDLDVTMPMEMDYSEWLEDLLPTDNNNTSSAVENSFNSSSNQNNMSLSPFYNRTDYGESNNDEISMSTNNNFYDQLSSVGFNSNNNTNSGNSQRDPLLSSRSLNIFSSAPETTIGSCGNSTLNLLSSQNELTSNNNRAPSPMAMGNDGLLWDFA